MPRGDNLTAEHRSKGAAGMWAYLRANPEALAARHEKIRERQRAYSEALARGEITKKRTKRARKKRVQS